MQRPVQPLAPPYLVNEVFESVQGEATFTGTPSLFIRLQGCPVGCPWCDTKHTWAKRPGAEIDADAMAGKTEITADTYARCDLATLAHLVGAAQSVHVVITGGEPCRYDLRPLIALLELRGHAVQVETSGTFAPFITQETWLTVSPKFDMPGGLAVREDALKRANEFKYPVGKEADIGIVLTRLEPLRERYGIPIWLQPLSLSRRATEICIAAARRHNWRVSLQTHKFIMAR